MAAGIHHEGVAKMKHGLLADSELSDGRAVGCLAALPKRNDVALVLLAKDTVVDDQQPWPPKKWICRVPPTGKRIDPESVGLRVVRVL